MKKSRLITVLLLFVILLMAAMSIFVGCDPKDEPDIDVTDPSGPIAPPGGGGNNSSTVKTYTIMGFLEKIVDSVDAPEKALGIDVEMDVIDSAGVTTTIAIRGNFYDQYHNELAFIVYRGSQTLFGLYMLNDKMYVDLGVDEYGNDKALLYLEDFNFNYIVSLVNAGILKVPELLGSVGSMLDSILDIVLGYIFERPVVTVAEDGSEQISMEIILKDFLNQIPGLLNRFASGLSLPIDLNELITYVASLLPEGTYMLRSNFDADGNRTFLGVEIANPEENKQTNFNLDINIADTAVETGIPTEKIENSALTNFSLTNLQFAIDVTLGTQYVYDANGNRVKNEDGTYQQKRLDVGQVINELLGETGILPDTFSLPEGLLLIEGGTGIRLAFALDLDLNYHNEPVDNNKIAIELYLLDQDGNIADGEGSKPQAGIYYNNGSFYVNLDNLLPNYMQNINIKVDAKITGLISALVKMISNAIDDALGTDFDAILNMGATVNGDGSVSIPTQDGLEQILSTANASVLSLSSGDNGEFVIGVGWVDFITAVKKIVKLNDNSIAIEKDKLIITADNDLLMSICNLIGTKYEDLGFEFPDAIPSVQLIATFFEGGLDNIAVTATISDTLDFGIKIHSFLIGYEDTTLAGRIDEITNSGNTKYLNSLSEIFDAALGGIILQTNFKMTFDKGKYNLAPFISSFGLPEIADIDIIWEFDEQFVMDLSIDMQVALDRTNNANSTFMFELKANEDMSVGPKGSENVIIKKDTVLIGIYGYQNSIYIDLAGFKIMNITLPKLTFDLNFSGLIFNILDDMVAKLLTSMGQTGGDLVFSFDLSELLGLSSAPSTEGATIATAASGGISAMSDEELSALVLLIGTDRIMPIVSMTSILAVINMINGDLINEDLSEALGMMKIDVDMSMGRTEGFVFEFTGNLIPVLDEDGVSVYYYKNGERLPSYDGNGNRKIYDKSQYDYKEYNYGEPFVLTFEMGTKEHPVTIGNIPTDKKYNFAKKAEEFSAYRSDLVQAIMDTVGTGSFELDLTLYTKDNQMDLQAMINTILASVGKRLEIPVNLNLDEWETEVKLLLQWKLDLTSSARTEVKLEMQYRGKTLIGVYIYHNSLIIDLEGLGFFSAELVNSSIVNNVFNMLSDFVGSIDEINLSKIINDLLVQAGLPTLPAAGADGSSDIATDDSLPTIGENIQTIDIIKFVLQAVSLHNTSIALNFSSTLINTLLNELLGINLGIDFTLGGELDLFGNSFELDLGVEDITVSALLQLNIGGEVDISVSPELIPDWDASSGELLARTLLDNLDIGLTIDIANNTSDANAVGYNYTRIKIWKSIGSAADRLLGTDGNAFVPAGNIIIKVSQIDEACYNNNTSGSDRPLLYAVLDYTATSNQLQLTLCTGVISLAVDFGKYVKNIGINLDLLGTLGGLFEGLFTTLDGAFASTGDAESASQELALADSDPVSEMMKPLTDRISNIDIIKLLSRGVNVNLRSNGNFNLDVEFDPYEINKLIDDVLSLIFSAELNQPSVLNLAVLAPDMFSKDYLRNVTWTRETGGTFWESLKAQLSPLLKDVISNMVSGVSWLITDALLNDVYNQIGKILRPILPFAVFNEFHVGLNVIDGTFANLYITGHDHYQTITGPDYTYKLENMSGRSAGYYTEIWVYNMFKAVGDSDHSISGKETGVVTWADIPSRIEYHPYAYVDDSNNDYGDGLKGGLYSMIETHFSNKTASYQDGSSGNIIKTGVTFSLIKYSSQTGVSADSNIEWDTVYADGTPVTQMDLSKKGTYIVQAKAQFTNNIVRTMDITITALGMGGEIEEIQDFSMHVYDDFPDFLTLVMSEDEETRKLSTSYVSITNYAPQQVKAHDVTATVVFPRKIDGVNVTKQVTIHYLDSTVNEVIINGEALAVENGVPSLIIDLYEFELTATSSIADYVSDVFYFKYSDGKAAGLTVNSDWTVADGKTVQIFDRFIKDELITNVNGEIFIVESSIGAGATLQNVSLRIWIRTKVVNKLEINGLEDTLRIDPYTYYLFTLYQSDPVKYSMYKDYDPFPETVLAYYYEEYDGIADDYDGIPEEVHVVWSGYENITYDWNTDNTFKGSQVTIGLDNGYEGYTGNFTWSRLSDVIILRNEIQAVYFDAELKQSTLIIDPFEYLLTDGDVYPEFAYVEFTNGTVLAMPIEWEVGNFKVTDYTSRMTQLRVKIGGNAKDFGINGDLEQYAYVNVRVSNLVPAGIDIAGSEYKVGSVYYIDPMQVLFYGEDPFPDSVTMVYTNGTRNTLHVNWDFDETQITLNGATGLFAIIKASNDKEYWYPIKVEIIDRSADMFSSTITDLEIDPYKYTTDSDGSRVYSAFVDSAYIYQEVATIVIGENGDPTIVGLRSSSGAVSSKYATYYEYVITYTDGSQDEIVYTSREWPLIELFYEQNSDDIADGIIKIQSAVVNEYFQVDVTWDLTEINYSVNDTYTVKMIAKANQGAAYDMSFKVNATILAKEVAYVGSENYYITISVGGQGLTEEELLTKSLTRNLSVAFYNGYDNNGNPTYTSGTYECTIDLSNVSLDFYNVSMELVTDGEGNRTYAYVSRATGDVVDIDDLWVQGTRVKVTVCSGDIAQVAYIYVVVVYDGMQA